MDWYLTGILTKRLQLKYYSLLNDGTIMFLPEQHVSTHNTMNKKENILKWKLIVVLSRFLFNNYSVRNLYFEPDTFLF